MLVVKRGVVGLYVQISALARRSLLGTRNSAPASSMTARKSGFHRARTCIPGRCAPVLLCLLSSSFRVELSKTFSHETRVECSLEASRYQPRGCTDFFSFSRSTVALSVLAEPRPTVFLFCSEAFSPLLWALKLSRSKPDRKTKHRIRRATTVKKTVLALRNFENFNPLNFAVPSVFVTGHQEQQCSDSRSTRTQRRCAGEASESLLRDIRASDLTREANRRQRGRKEGRKKQ
jgi:hypothetical protein